MIKKTLILTNSSLTHIEESESFRRFLQSQGFEAEIFLVDDGRHTTRQFGLQKIIQLINFKKIKRLLSVILSGSVSTILVTAPIPMVLILIPFLKKKKVKLVYTFHEPFMPERKVLYYRLTDYYHSVLVPNVDDLLFYSQNALSLYREHNPTSSIPCHLIPLYKYRAFIDTVPDFQQRKYISFIGNMGSNKDLKKFFAIAEGLPSMRFLLAGSGNLNDYKDEISKLDNVTVVNRFLTEAEYFSYLDKSIYVVLPYTSASQSGVVLDVMCRGGIAVCTNIPAFAEIINHMETGIILDYESFSENFIESLPSLSTSKQFDISARALESYNANFSEIGFFDAIKSTAIKW